MDRLIQRFSNSMRLNPQAEPRPEQARAATPGSSMGDTPNQPGLGHRASVFRRPRPASLAAPQEPLGFDQQLDAWVRQAGLGEKRRAAAAKIREVVRSGETELDLSKLNLRSLPDCFEKLDHVRDFFFYDNKLTRLPASFFKMSGAQMLDLTSNRFESLPSDFNRLENLEVLSLSKNKLAILPSNFGDTVEIANPNAPGSSWSKSSKLHWLDLSENQLTHLSTSFGHFISLEHLELQHNKLEKLPENIGFLSNLNYLNLEENKLSALPASFAWLDSLRVLVLSKNHFQNQPPAILYQMRSFNKLYI